VVKALPGENIFIIPLSRDIMILNAVVMETVFTPFELRAYSYVWQCRHWLTYGDYCRNQKVTKAILLNEI